MIYHSVYGTIIAVWKWSGGVINLASFLFFVAMLIWNLVIARRRHRDLREIRSSLPPVRSEWIEMQESNDGGEGGIEPSPFATSSIESDGDGVIMTDVRSQTTKRLPRVLLHVSFALLMMSLAYWPWMYVAFDLLDFYSGLLGIWAVVVVAWVTASGPSLFRILLSLYDTHNSNSSDETLLATESGGARTSPSMGRARPPSPSFGDTCRQVVWRMWVDSLRRKLTGSPAYKELKGDTKIKRRWYKNRWGRLVVFYGGLCALLFFTWFLLFASSSLCITDHPVEFSTRFTRSFSSPTCSVSAGALCHVYVMPPYDGSKEMIVNVVLLGERGQTPVTVDYKSASQGANGFIATAASVVRLPLPDGEGPRYAQAVLLSSLLPDTVYNCRVSAGNDSTSFSFRSLPSNGDVPIVIGGDSGTEPDFATLLDVVAKRDVRMVMVAGDVGYANGLRSCYRRWDEWLAIWHAHMRTAQGHLMPLLTSIGNHDVGPGGHGTYWSGLFVQNKQALAADRWQDRQTYHAHVISNHTVLVVLDTGHVVSAADQVEWMEGILSSHAGMPNKVAVYHIPMYPSRRAYDGAINIDLREHWLPVFDKHKIDVGFEHHDHAYKKTKKMKGNVPNVNGTLYLGDGCFGVPAKALDANRPYLETASATEHGFFVRVAEEVLDIEAFDPTGHVFDRITVP
jgi:hypothetical protein